MQIIKNRKIVNNDWKTVGLTDELTAGNIIVPLERWQNERESLLASHKDQLGIILPNDLLADDIKGDINHFAIIVLEFPVFRDGRAYTQARLLRDRFGFKGEIRATGDVFKDQLYLMERCGIDAYVLKEGKDLESALTAFSEFTIKYQPAADGPATIS